MNASKQPNRLQNETSPYLKQHRYNPVNWYPWSTEAFNTAKKEHKPIFLSIGYATCHWCHVMAHESFEDDEIAKLLNDTFICIKVDREERPDIDQIYMKVCQMLTGSGGWPLTIMMTPDKKPFFAATYIPKQSRYGIKGLQTLIPEIKQRWDNQKDDLVASAAQITKTLKSSENEAKNKITVDKHIFENCYEQLFHSFDEIHGGFGSQPKFPMPHYLLFLLRYWKQTETSYSLQMVTTTLEQMRQGGIYDHIGFGFHRYATDRTWKIPHFEKMLYDQALLLMAYTEAYQATKKQLFKQTGEEIISYIKWDMTADQGGFYSAEDADSEGEEGKYYTWTYDELKESCNAQQLNLLNKFYNVEKNGNIKSAPMINKDQNILYHSMSKKEYATYYQIDEHKLTNEIEQLRSHLFQLRKQRQRPEKDDKILTNWNGLMIAALAKAARVFQQKTYATIAEKAMQFIVSSMMNENHELLHSYTDNQAKITGYAEDYAFLIWGLIELYQTTFHKNYLQLSLDLTDYLLKHFWDDTHHGLFFTSDTAEKILTRTKEGYDGAVPSANSVSLYNLIRLARITGNTTYEEKADQIKNAFSNQIQSIPSNFTQMMTGLDFAYHPSYEIIIVGKKEEKDTQHILQQIHSRYMPNNVVIIKDMDKTENRLEDLLSYLKDYTQIKDKATIYVCKQYQCKQPTTDIEKMKELINEQEK